MKFRYIILIFFFSLSELLSVSKAAVSEDEEDSARIIRGPYLQCVSQTGIVIRWRTNLPTSSRVVFGTSISSPDLEKTDRKDTTEHVIRLTGLKPGTKYFYNVGNEGGLYGDMDSLNYFVTSPTSLNEKPVRIWATGDFGTADSAARAVEQAYLNYRTGWHTDVWLMLGDNAYTRGSDEQYQEAVFGGIYKELLGNTVIWPTPGNHDMRSADSETQTGPYYDIFSLPVNAEAGGAPSGTEAYYSFDYGNVHIISMDTEDTPVEKDSEMIRWLEKDLDANGLKWTIVFFHHPPYSMGTHNSDMHWDSGGRMTRIREYILPVLDAHGVDLVLGGHSHVYERSYMIHDHFRVNS